MSTDLRADIEAAYRAWDAAFNKADAKALAATYLEDATFLPPTHAVVSGRAEIETFFAGLFASGVTGHDLQVVRHGGDGRIAYAAARWLASGKGSDGGRQELGGIATHVFERQPDGSLKLRLHTFN